MSKSTSAWKTLPARMPRWLAHRPELLVAALRCVNLPRRHRMLGVLAAMGGVAVMWVLAQAWFASFIENAAIDAWIVVVVMAAHTVTSVARRRSRLQDGRAQSWLAPLPYRLSPRARLVALPVIEILIFALLLGIACGIGSLEFGNARTVVLAAVSGACLGGLLSFFMSRATTRKAEEWRYAIVREPRAQWASNPRLHPLSFWPIALGRVQFNPGMMARTVAPVLLAIPLGTGGQTVIALVGAWVVALYLLSLLFATVRAVVGAARWLAPTAISVGRVLAYVTYRALVMQVVTIGLVALALIALNGSSALSGAASIQDRGSAGAVGGLQEGPAGPLDTPTLGGGIRYRSSAPSSAASIQDRGSAGAVGGLQEGPAGPLDTPAVGRGIR